MNNWKLIQNGFFTVTLVMTSLLSHSYADDLVMFTANWCAGCREVLPIAQKVAGSKGLILTTIDVDQSDAPKKGKQFGLDIPRKELPQVYAIGKNGIQLIYDGSSHLWGQPSAIEQRITSQL